MKTYQPPPRKYSELLTAPLTVSNYKDKFLLLNELEKEEHKRALKRSILTAKLVLSDLPCNGVK